MDDTPPWPPPPRRRASRSPPTTRLLPDDVLLEILHRLPPSPSVLPRLSLVCTHWRRLVADPRFHRRFHSPDHRRRTPPLLGFFHNSFNFPCFVPTDEPPNRVPAETFSLRRHPGRWLFLGCRHGRALLASPFAAWRLLMVWDPLAGHRHDIPIPPAFHQMYFRSAALLSDAVDCRRRGGADAPFRVVFAFVDQARRPSACVYSSESGAWGDLVSLAAAIEVDLLLQPRNQRGEYISNGLISDIDMKPPVLVGNTLYWLLMSNYLLEFNMDTKSLAVIDGPDMMYFLAKSWSARIMPVEGGGKLGFAAVRMLYLHLWVREVASDGTANWVMGSTVELDLFLPPEVPKTVHPHLGAAARYALLGFSEDGSVAFLQTTIGVFMVELDVMKFKMVLPEGMLHVVYPYSSFYLTDGCIDNDQ